MSHHPDYIPGTCNIGPHEIKSRKNFAIFSAALGVALIAFLLLSHAGKMWRLFEFIPAASFGIGFQQWYYKFCVNFGLRGLFNFGEMGKTFSVEQKEHFHQDQAKAWKMIITGIVFAIIITILFYLFPSC